jgi:hypothetical protein
MCVVGACDRVSGVGDCLATSQFPRAIMGFAVLPQLQSLFAASISYPSDFKWYQLAATYNGERVYVA